MLRSLASQIPRVTAIAATSGSHQQQCIRHMTASTRPQQPQQQQRSYLNRRLEVDLQELTMMQCLEDVTLIDVRQPAELHKQEQIPGSVHIPLGNLRGAFQLSDTEWQQKFNIAKPTKTNKGIIFYARGPNASSAAVEIAHKLGWKKSRHYVGGWEDYCSQKNIPFLKTTTNTSSSDGDGSSQSSNKSATSTGGASSSTSPQEDSIKQHYNYHYYNPDLHYL